MGDVLTTAMRWLHLSSVVTLLGGIIYARFVIAPSEACLTADARTALDECAAANFRPVLFTAMTCLIVSGLFNFIVKQPQSPVYHALFGVKILLALHIFAVAILIAQPRNKRRNRQMFGAIISGLVVILISNYLKGIA
jgi:cytochrome bd-type quinol oxidase subunit 2